MTGAAGIFQRHTIKVVGRLVIVDEEDTVELFLHVGWMVNGYMNVRFTDG
jgi:hypothetical protein